MPQNRLQDNLNRVQLRVDEQRPLLKQAKMRQYYHFMAQQGWINDPNGLIFYKGKYHLFYQYNPYASFWGEMYWGHAVSTDLMHWEHLPAALAPSEPYDEHPQGGCFSGSAVEHEGKLYLLYTGATNKGNGFEQTQCVAYSEDGIQFEKYDKNPVITAPEGYDQANFRDPKVWKHEDWFYLVCGAKKDQMAKALLYRSQNLLEWEYVNVLAESRGELGFMWECPDFYPLGDKYVLMFSPMGSGERTSVYLVGDMDYATGKFHYDTIGEMDWGFDYYAPQSFVDGKGRRILIAWANGWDWMPWWKDWGPTYREGWCGSFNIPREVRLAADGTLQFLPVEETALLHGAQEQKAAFSAGKERCLLPAGNGISYEMVMEIDLQETTAEKFRLLLRCSETEETVITFDLKHAEMTFDRNHSDGWSRGISRSPLLLKDKNLMKIHILADQSSLEIFTDDYRTIHSGNVFADDSHNRNFIMAENGTLRIKNLCAWGMEKVMD